MNNSDSTLISLNMPKSYPSLGVPCEDYTADVMNAMFKKAVEELPSEITVLDHFLPANYPKSLQNEVFVAQNGSDENNGTKDAPFATVAKALSELKARGAKGGVIRLKGGIYGEQIIIGAENAGEADAPLFITSAEGENVQLHGSFTLKGSDFGPVTDPEAKRKLGKNADNVVVADLNKVGIDVDKVAKIIPNQIPSLIVDGVQGILARFPNKPKIPNDFSDLRDQRKEGGVRETSFSRVNDEEESPLHLVFDKNEVPLKDWEFTDDMWIAGSLFFEWTSWHWNVLELDKEENSITTGPYFLWKRHGGMTWRPSNEFYFYNFIEGIDEPGEWFLDRKTGMLYYYPLETFTADSVVQIVGEERETAILVEKSANVVISNLEISGTNGRCVSVNESHDVVVDHCRFEHCSSRAATLFNCCLRSGVIYSEYIGRGNLIASPDSHRKTLTPTNNFFQNNFCHSYKFQTSIAFQGGVGDVISHNKLIDSGFTMGWSNETVVEYNEVIGGPLYGIDTGYIYCWGANFSARGAHIRYNYFHDNKTCYSGIYLDVRLPGNYVYGNVVTGNRKVKSMRDVCLTGDNCVANNILIHGRDGILGNAAEWGSNGRVAIFDVDIARTKDMEQPFWDRYPQLRYFIERVERVGAIEKEGLDTGKELVCDDEAKLLRWGGYHPSYNNVFVGITNPVGGGDEYIRCTVPGYETNLISEGDVGFVDYENGNFRLKPDSIVYEKIPEWKDIPMDKIGLLYEVQLDS